MFEYFFSRNKKLASIGWDKFVLQISHQSKKILALLPKKQSTISWNFINIKNCTYDYNVYLIHSINARFKNGRIRNEES